MRDSDLAMAELRMRLARGEIQPDEYHRTKLLLEASSVPAEAPSAQRVAIHRVPTETTSGMTSKPMVVGVAMLVASVIAMLFSFAPWYSVLGVNVNPWFVSGFGSTEWWLANQGTAIQGADLIRFVGPAIGIGLLLAGGSGVAVMQEKRIRWPAVIMGTLGVGIYASASALAVFIAFKNELDIGQWSFGLWASVIALLGMLVAAAFFTPDKKAATG